LAGPPPAVTSLNLVPLIASWAPRTAKTSARTAHANRAWTAAAVWAADG